MKQGEPTQAVGYVRVSTDEQVRFDRSLKSDPTAGSKYRVIWRPQRDSNPCCHLERVES